MTQPQGTERQGFTGLSHPLRGVSMGNFKSVRSASVDLSPFTVVVGSNSTGKSTLLQAVLALAQGMAPRSDATEFPLNGELVRLGDFEEVRHFAAQENAPISLGFAANFANPRARRSRSTQSRPQLGIEASFTVHVVAPEAGRRTGATIRDLRMNASSPYPIDEDDWEFPEEDIFATAFIRPLGTQRARVALEHSSSRGYVGRTDVQVRGHQTTHLEVRNAGAGEFEVDAMSMVGCQPVEFYRATDPYLYLVRNWLGVAQGIIENGEADPVFSRREPKGMTPARIFALVAMELGLATPATRPQVENLIRSIPEGGVGPKEKFSRAQMVATIAADVSLALLAVSRTAGEVEDGIGSNYPRMHHPGRFFRRLIAARGLPQNSNFRELTEQIEESYWLNLGDSPQEVWPFLADVRTAIGDGPLEIGIVPKVLTQVESPVLTRRFAERNLNFFHERVWYLGPLREAPNTSTTTSNGGRGIGARGEFAAAYLHEHQRDLVDVPIPGGGSETMELSRGLNLWLEHLGLVREAQVRDYGRLNFQLSVIPLTGDVQLDLGAVGVGVSQALPVILQCLIAEPGSIVLLEQPELHLHPKLQQDLADFLLACVRSGRQLLVETHSEHMVNRLRRRIADEASLTDVIGVLFAEQEDGETTYRRAEINRAGGLAGDWPKGFFELAAEEARELLEAGIRAMTSKDPEAS